MEKKNIKTVLRNELCTGCGTCEALCPKNAIKMEINKKGTYTPKINEERCGFCGICYNICPGQEIDYKQMNKEIFGKEPDNFIVGHFLDSYTGFSNDINIRINSSSGGLITQILIFALESGLINGALVSKMNKDKPWEPEPFIARTKQELIEASQSKYCPIPVNYALKYILRSNKNEKFAFVGLPCHMNGVRKAEKINKDLRNKIVLHIGLFCNHTPNLWATRLLLQRYNINQEEVVGLQYRGNGWPGFMEVTTSKEKILIPQSESWRFIGSHFFFPKRCLICDDSICELADLSCGDAWLQEFSSDNKGTSICIAKNEYANNLLKMMVSSNELNLTKIDIKKVIKSQSGMLYLKKQNVISRMKIFKNIKEGGHFEKTDVIDTIISIYILFNSQISSNIIIKKILVHVPLKLIYIYNTPYIILLSIKTRKYLKRLLENFERPENYDFTDCKNN